MRRRLEDRGAVAGRQTEMKKIGFSHKFRITTSLRRHLVAFAAILTLSACAHTSPEIPPISQGDYSSMQRHLIKYISEEMEKYHVPGVSIALVDDQKIIWAEGFGFADRERQIPATAETVYQLGSITKPVTATAAMKLVEEGNLDLDRPLQSYLSNFSMRRLAADNSPVTPRALLSHHAGLPRYFVKGLLSVEPHSVLLDGLNGDYVLYSQGTRFDYSNVGFAFMGDVIEIVSGRPYASFVKDEVFRPLGMDNSAFSVNEDIAPSAARGYSERGLMPDESFRDQAPSAMVSNVLDLGRFIRFIFADGTFDGKQIIKKKTLDAMFERQYPKAQLDFGTHYGLGWFLGGIPGLEDYSVAWHEGRTLSFWNKLILLRDKKLGVVVLSNSAAGRVLTKDVAQVAMRMLLQAHDGSAQEVKSRHAPCADVGSSIDEDWRKFAGDYSFMGTLAQVYADDEKLKVRVRGQVVDIVPTGGGNFRLEKKILGIFPVRLGFLKMAHVNGNDYIVTFEKCALSGERIPPHKIPAQWKKRLGDYRLVNPDEESVVHFKRVRLIIEDGLLQLDVDSDQPEAQGKIVLMPVSDEAAYILGASSTGGINGTFVGRTANNREQVWFSGYLFERIGQRVESRID